MAMDQKKLTRIRIGDLLDICKSCTVTDKEKRDGVCNSCPTHKEIQSLGDTLHNEKKRIPEKPQKEVLTVPGSTLSIDDYLKLRSQGMKDKEIRELKGLSSQQLANWKYTRKEKLKEAEDKMAVGTETVQDKEPSTKSIDWKKQYEELNAKYKALEDVEEQLKKTKEKLVSTAERLNSTRFECDEALNAVREKDYALENQKELASRLKVENKAMRELLKLWI